jgi:hypothetical protein
MDNQTAILFNPDNHINSLFLPCIAQILSWSPDHYFAAVSDGALIVVVARFL